MYPDGVSAWVTYIGVVYPGCVGRVYIQGGIPTMVGREYIQGGIPTMVGRKGIYRVVHLSRVHREA